MDTTFKLYLVTSDDVTGLMTEGAYEELTLQMSTGDYHSHSAVLTSFKLLGLEDWTGVFDIDGETGELVQY